MELRLVPEDFNAERSISRLYVDGVFECFVLEDAVREVPGQPVSSWKIPGMTAIPMGRYRVIITMSARFGRLLPILVDVPGFTGVRIHPGNVATDTDGCLLPGRHHVGDSVTESKLAFNALFDKLQGDPDCWITIERA